jgi:creatinine amidohydrolase
MILNGHGGNDFKQIIRELGMKYPGLFMCTCNWYQSFNNSSFFERDGGHADEMETSMMLHVSPDLVLPLAEAGKGEGKKFRIGALNEKWAWAERKWSQVTSDTGIGDPSLASAEKGERCFIEVTQKLARFIEDLCSTGNNDMYKPDRES